MGRERGEGSVRRGIGKGIRKRNGGKGANEGLK